MLLPCLCSVWCLERSGEFWIERTALVYEARCTRDLDYDEACLSDTSWWFPAPYEWPLRELPNQTPKHDTQYVIRIITHCSRLCVYWLIKYRKVCISHGNGLKNSLQANRTQIDRIQLRNSSVLLISVCKTVMKYLQAGDKVCIEDPVHTRPAWNSS